MPYGGLFVVSFVGLFLLSSTDVDIGGGCSFGSFNCKLGLVPCCASIVLVHDLHMNEMPVPFVCFGP